MATILIQYELFKYLITGVKHNYFRFKMVTIMGIFFFHLVLYFRKKLLGHVSGVLEILAL